MVSEQDLDLIRRQMSSVRAPSHYDRVYKDECQYSYDTPFSTKGLYISLHSWQGFGHDYVDIDAKRRGQQLYLHEIWHKVPLTDDERQAQEQKPEKLAIGGDKGFQVDQAEHVNKHSEVILVSNTGPLVTVPLPCDDLPEVILNAIRAIQAHDSASKQDQVQTWEEQRPVSKYALDLQQEPAKGKKVPSNPAEWQCAETAVKENLWLNLSTGSIGSGRQNWDGSGGNGAALRHFEATGSKYPLVVKLGTITPHGADVFSYAPDENDMVEDPKLAEHLSHWGINMLAMQKTEKTMAEAEIEANKDFEWSHITESGKQLTPMSGPGYIGLKNLGNSCYMNSVLQVLWTLPQLQKRYVDVAQNIYQSAADPSNDFATQMAKVGVALTTGRTGAPPVLSDTPMEEDLAPSAMPSTNSAGQVSGAGTRTQTEADAQNWVQPQSFKSLVGRGHPEFASGHQQDAREYFQHLLEVMSRSERSSMQRLGAADQPASADAFKFELEDRIQCLETGRVSYKRSLGNILAIDIPMDAATNKDELEDYQEREAKRAKLKSENASAYIQEDASTSGKHVTTDHGNSEPVLPKVPFSACLAKWAGEEVMADYYSAAAGHKTQAKRYNRIANFPPYLMLQINRYYVTQEWVAKKLEALVDVSEQLDLEWLRGRGPHPDEHLQPEDAQPSANPASTAGGAGVQGSSVQPDPEIVTQLMGMGFSENGSKRAAVATKGKLTEHIALDLLTTKSALMHNAGTEGAMNWVLGHMEDADFNDPLPNASSSDGAPEGAADPESIMMLVSMGFTDQQATAALKACHGSLERAADWLFSHADDLESAVASVSGTAAQPAADTSAPDADPSKLSDGPGQYELLGIISHMGRNTACGHYVCHLKKSGKWVIFNDEKVAISENPPKDLAYMYLLRRKDIVER